MTYGKIKKVLNNHNLYAQIESMVFNPAISDEAKCRAIADIVFGRLTGMGWNDVNDKDKIE